MKKFLTLILIIAMLFSSIIILSGCSFDFNKEEEKVEEKEEEEVDGLWNSGDFTEIGLKGAKQLKGYVIEEYTANRSGIEISYKIEDGEIADIRDFAETLFSLSDNYSGEFNDDFTIELQEELETLDDAVLIELDSYVSYWWYYKNGDEIYQVLVSGDEEIAELSILRTQ